MKSNTGIIASAKIKIPKMKTGKLKENLKKIDREIYVNFCDGIVDDSLWNEKRLLLAAINKSCG
jgi:hypothetical protein